MKNTMIRVIFNLMISFMKQSNGVAKRKNKTLQEMISSMLSYWGLSDGFSGEAMLTACHILNRVPTNATNKSHYDLWYKKSLILSYVRVLVV